MNQQVKTEPQSKRGKKKRKQNKTLAMERGLGIGWNLAMGEV